MNIGVFDSGRGGEFARDRLAELFPSHVFIVRNDQDHAPYGTKTAKEITALTDAALQPLIEKCPLIVIACNTATTAAITTLRKRYPKTTFVGYEPMVKPAAAITATKKIIVLATLATRRSARYLELCTKYTQGVEIAEADTSGWATLIDNKQTERVDLSEVADFVGRDYDTIVIACTHYRALIPRLRSLFPSTILEPTDAVARRIQRYLKEPTASIN